MLVKTIFFSIFVTIFNINSIAATINDHLCDIEINIENIEDGIGNYLVLVNAKNQLLIDNVQTSPEGAINLRLPISALFSSEGNHSIVVYSTDSGLSLVHLQNLYLSSEHKDNCKSQVNDHIRQKRASPSGHSFGLQYSIWHTHSAFAQRKIARSGGKPTTVERIIERGGSLSDYFSHGVTEADAGGGYYMVESKYGFYCTYRKRPTEAYGAAEDCPDIEQTFARHAEVLTASGVDYVYVDLTNICSHGPEEDGMTFFKKIELIMKLDIQLFREDLWNCCLKNGINYELRKKATPQIVAWNRLREPGCVTWKYYLDLYNKYPDLVWRDHKTNKMVFMATDISVESLRHQVESNGGKNDVVVVHNWVVDHLAEANAGRWQFLGHCGAQQDKGSTDIVGRASCDQLVTRNSPIGDQISVGVSYQNLYASVPWGASGSYYGLTFLLQWETALRENPQHITISGWNEFTAGPQKNPFGGYSHSIGIDGSKDNRLFVDLYGAFRSRDIEPTVEYGESHYLIMQSCIRVRNLNLHNNRHDCSVANEVCCKIAEYKQFVEIHSMLKKDNTDYMLVNTPQEKTTISATYNQICAYSPTTFNFCIGGLASDPNAGLSGPFVIFNRNGVNRQPLYRCKDGDGHFISADVKCEGHINDQLLGYTSTKKDSLFARSLNRCVTAAGHRYHVLDGPCHPNDKFDKGNLGYAV